MKTRTFLKGLITCFLLFIAFQTQAQTPVEHNGGHITYLDRPFKPLEPLEQYPATLTLSLDAKTNTYFITIAPEKGEPYTFEFAKPTQKEKCGSLVGKGKDASSGIRFRVSGLDCKIANPRITIRNQNKEISFALTEKGNEQAVSELKKVWVKK